MIAVDTNILVYAHRLEFDQHESAVRAVRRLAEGDDAWALPVFVLGEFLRVVTHPRIFDRPTPRSTAVEAVSGLVASPSLRLLHPGERFWPLLQAAMDDAGVTGNLVLDAEIVAVCREHGVNTLLSEDKDFRRFPSVAVRTLADG